MNSVETLPNEELGRMVDSTLAAFQTALSRHAELMAGQGSTRTSLSHRTTRLANNLLAVRDRYTNARSSVLGAINEIATSLQLGRVQFSEALSPTDLWRTPSVLNVAITSLDPVLAVMLPSDSLSGWESWQGSRMLPLAEHLRDSKDCEAITHELRRMAAEIDHAVEHGYVDDDLKIIALAESLMAISDALEQIGKSWPRATVRWCACCFRRAPHSSRYCNLHLSGPKSDGKDTLYRKSMRTRASFSKATEVEWTRHQAVRHVLTEPYRRLVGPGSAWVPHDGQTALVTEEILLLALHSEWLSDWVSVRPLWDAFIQRSCPAVAQRVGNMVSKTTDWRDFCCKLHVVLDNRHEDTTSSLSILYLLIEADDWFNAEHACQDRRATDNAQRIAELFDAGVCASEIARLLGVSRQYVYRLKSQRSTQREADLPVDTGVAA